VNFAVTAEVHSKALARSLGDVHGFTGAPQKHGDTCNSLPNKARFQGRS
jgi:hypothetical protein